MAVHTLSRMAAGGIRDHAGGGFHRYSVDARWLVPHFEKMLYDNALLARALTRAHLLGATQLGAVAEETLDYVLGDLTSPEGVFYSARDADSEGEEGLFYLWTPAEVRDVLGRDEARLLTRVYDVSETGNFEGRNILHLPHDLDAVARREGIARDELERRLRDSLRALKDRRAARPEPLRDDKVLTAWNGFTIRALAEAGPALGRPDYTAAGARAADFLLGDDAARATACSASSRPGAPTSAGSWRTTARWATPASRSMRPRWKRAGSPRAARIADEVVARFWSPRREDVPRRAGRRRGAAGASPATSWTNATPSGELARGGAAGASGGAHRLGRARRGRRRRLRP